MRFASSTATARTASCITAVARKVTSTVSLSAETRRHGVTVLTSSTSSMSLVTDSVNRSVCHAVTSTVRMEPRVQWFEDSPAASAVPCPIMDLSVNMTIARTTALRHCHVSVVLRHCVGLFKATWSVRGFLFLLQKHVIWYKLYLFYRKDSRGIFETVIT